MNVFAILKNGLTLVSTFPPHLGGKLNLLNSLTSLSHTNRFPQLLHSNSL